MIIKHNLELDIFEYESTILENVLIYMSKTKSMTDSWKCQLNDINQDVVAVRDNEDRIWNVDILI
jgi:hypothetical protein